MELALKYCPCCNRKIPTDQFYRHKNRYDGLSCYCKECTKKRNHDSYHRNHITKDIQIVSTPMANSTKPTTENRPLKDIKSRELLEELKSRGYVWDKMWIQQYVEYSKI